jgi:hypothetical protein
MSVDPEVLSALAQAVRENGQAEGLESALAAWLKAMCEKEIGQNDHKRHLEASKHAVNTNSGS